MANPSWKSNTIVPFYFQIFQMRMWLKFIKNQVIIVLQHIKMCIISSFHVIKGILLKDHKIVIFI
ncbi:hypothetical protein E2562_004923 [Oryza meyeriana var. granulata]|uniref:Uncharacterized protein n=1 Tax=Oryza meyeriana var. granulata TaxID=110450 RepID=A0A6G1C5U7_9ORYZ|nr:hypothetical protein E2562_004923 [Oryza meyeriana var. granulata]